ncbi:MAG: hypothetical protein HOE11_00340 [Candidatus Diapherotrites archaeon]|jgi:hypothetical protein|nr:hypothetical protein [Candidatus Diapherotrites archaeon]MBT4596610.1 hypothetical protein [Candidatus Diapherotrites archaeon]
MKKWNEKQVLTFIENISKSWIEIFNEMEKHPIAPKYLYKLMDLITKDFELVRPKIEMLEEISPETDIKMLTTVMHTFNCYIRVRSISCSKWDDKHHNFLDRFVGNRNIELPNILKLIRR